MILSVVLAIVGGLVSERFISIFTDNPLIISQGRDYLVIVTIFCFGSIITQAAFATLQGSGEMIKPMIGQILGAVSNIILNPIMIFSLLGFPALGIRGSALATVTGQIIGMIYMLVVVFKGKKNFLKLNFKVFHFDATIIKDIIVVGLPAAVMQGLGSVMITGYNLILATFGMSAVAVFRA